jgi:UDPglucose 6-dehydrogenase
MKYISIIGMGYVGLCTAVGFASKKSKIIAVEKDIEKLSLIKNGRSPFHEPHLNALLQKSIENEFFRCTSDLDEAVLKTQVTFITVGTPSKPDGSIDLSQILTCAAAVGKALVKTDRYHLVVIKSTVIPETTGKYVRPLLERYSKKRCGSDFGLCMNPEFIREGSAMYDTLHPDRIIIGKFDEKSGEVLEELYRKLYSDDIPPIIKTSLSTAEIIKYANNTFLATKISYINTIANICEKIPEADIKIVANALGLDNRINPKFLRAGLGYGGSCFSKDINALITFSKQNNYNPTFLESIQEVNAQQINHVIELAETKLGPLFNKKIAILGLSFKPETDDLREARSIQLITKLINKGAKISVYDPVAMPNAKMIFKNKITYNKSSSDCLKNAECCIIVTEWNEFKKLKPENYKEKMKNPIVIDGRRIYNPKDFNKGITYIAIGLGNKD